MTPEDEAALIARAVATCREHRDITGYGETGERDDDGPALVCSLSAHHDGIVHYDPVDGVLWIPAQPGMTRDQAGTVAARIREAMA